MRRPLADPTASACQNLADRFGPLPAYRRRDVRVRVERQADLAALQPRLREPCVNSLGQQFRGASMAERVEPDVRKEFGRCVGSSDGFRAASFSRLMRGLNDRRPTLHFRSGSPSVEQETCDYPRLPSISRRRL